MWPSTPGENVVVVPWPDFETVCMCMRWLGFLDSYSPSRNTSGESSPGTIFQVIENWFSLLHNGSINLIDFYWSVWIGGSLLSTFQLTIAIEISHIHRNIQSLLFQTNHPGISRWTLRRFLSGQTSHLIIQCFHYFRKSLHPFSGSLKRFHVHLLRILKTEKTFTQCSIESFYYSLIAVNVHIADSDPDIMFRHLFLYITHEFTSSINLKNRGPSQWSFVNFLKSLWNFQRLFGSEWFSGFESASNINHRQCILQTFLPLGSRSGRNRRSAWWTELSHQTLVLGYFGEQEDISARWLALSTRVLRHPQRL